MSRLIDADKLKDAVYKSFTPYQREWASTINQINKAIDAQPTVDAVPVVRCKNCTRWGTGVAGETEHVKCCEFGRYMVGENGYCVYGELRTSAE